MSAFTTLDPVCGRLITNAAVAQTVDSERRTYDLCSDECRECFSAHPALYVTGSVPLVS